MNVIFETSTHKTESVGTLYIPEKSDTERNWRDSELLRTDALYLLDDYPASAELKAYRRKLRNYPGTNNFPNGDRPIL